VGLGIRNSECGVGRKSQKPRIDNQEAGVDAAGPCGGGQEEPECPLFSSSSITNWFLTPFTFNSFRQRWCQQRTLPFTDVLSAERIEALLVEEGVEFRESVFTPLVTLIASRLGQRVDVFASDFRALPKGSNGSASALGGHAARRAIRSCALRREARLAILYADCILRAKAGPRILRTTLRNGKGRSLGGRRVQGIAFQRKRRGDVRSFSGRTKKTHTTRQRHSALKSNAAASRRTRGAATFR
jgi:hypothetical protein